MKIKSLSLMLIAFAFFNSCSSTRKYNVPDRGNELSETIIKKEKKIAAKIKILYGTDRQQIRDGNKQLRYANDPAYPGTAKYDVGYTIVSIPPNHITGRLERASIWKLEFRQDTLKHIVQKEIVPLSGVEFNQMLANPQNGESAFIFVHGYNTSFEDAALRTAQLAFDIHLPITPIMFSWSSNNSAVAYPSDEDRVQLAIPAFIDFLKRVAQKGHFRKIHLIAHSMGNRLVSLAMLQMANEKVDLKIDQVIMAAPDIYVNLFQLNLASAIAQKVNHITIYTASNDLALMASKAFHNDLRLGEIGKPPPSYVFNKIDIIDSFTQKFDLWGHDRFARSPAIINDIDLILKFDYNADQRGVHREMVGRYDYYRFP
jgi:esterase/lipase superfamily enzyme